MRPAVLRGALWPAPGSHLLANKQALLRRPWAVLATTRRDGALWAHFVVGLPCNIRDIAALALLELHPTSPPSHTCLLLR